MKKLIVLGCMLVAALGIWAAKSAWDNRDGRCILPWQRQATVGGAIRVVGGGTFSAGVVMYYLYYPGTYVHSGKVCEAARRVTEAKYNRELFGLPANTVE